MLGNLILAKVVAGRCFANADHDNARGRKRSKVNEPGKRKTEAQALHGHRIPKTRWYRSTVRPTIKP